MKKLVILLSFLFLCVSCNNEPDKKDIQAKKAKEAANSLNFVSNAEIDNIKKRLELTSDPGIMGYILLLNEAGQPIFYTTVKGKITSSGKRLTRPMEYHMNGATLPEPSDEGTYGNADIYIYFWSATGQYYQWNGKYLYSNKPFRLSVEPLVIAIDK